MESACIKEEYQGYMNQFDRAPNTTRVCARMHTAIQGQLRC